MGPGRVAIATNGALADTEGMETLSRILHAAWDATVEAAPFIVLGTVFAGLIKALLDPARLRRWLADESPSSVFVAALAGVPLPLCSCSVLPVAAQLRRAGASRAATGAFLVSTPETGVDSILLTIGVMNPWMACARVVGAFFTASATGLAQILVPVGAAPAGRPTASFPTLPAAPLGERLIAGQRYAFVELLGEMAHLYMFGLLATGVVMGLMPEDFLARFLGGGIGGMVVVALVGAASYICASSSTPLAAALIARGMSPGTALVLLLAGPATSLASMAAVRSLLGTRGLVAYLCTIIGCAIAMGLGLDWVAETWQLPVGVMRGVEGAGTEASVHGPAAIIAGIGLAVFLCAFTAKWLLARVAPAAGKAEPAHAASAGGCSCCHAHADQPATVEGRGPG